MPTRGYRRYFSHIASGKIAAASDETTLANGAAWLRFLDDTLACRKKTRACKKNTFIAAMLEARAEYHKRRPTWTAPLADGGSKCKRHLVRLSSSAGLSAPRFSCGAAACNLVEEARTENDWMLYVYSSTAVTTAAVCASLLEANPHVAGPFYVDDTGALGFKRLQHFRFFCIELLSCH
jgi:hypothetical protein